MKTYLVQWSIDIEAETPREAATKAREIQLDPESFATHFVVSDSDFSHYVNVDLEERFIVSDSDFSHHVNVDLEENEE